MISNFLKITFRNLRKNSSYSLLNIFGLAIGITCAGLIFLWVENELSWDQFLPKKDRLALGGLSIKFWPRIVYRG